MFRGDQSGQTLDTINVSDPLLIFSPSYEKCIKVEKKFNKGM